MNKIVHLSLARKEVPIRIDVVKGATTPGIDFVLDDYLPESGATARIYIKKRETEVYNDCEISDNVVTFTPTTGSFDEVGECQAQLQIIEGEDVAVSFRMWVDVEENLIDNSAIESSNEYGALIDMTNDISALKSEVAQIISGASSVDPDAELIDIRVAYNGTTYQTAGDAVRGQVSDLERYTLKPRTISEYYSGDTLYIYDLKDTGMYIIPNGLTIPDAPTNFYPRYVVTEKIGGNFILQYCGGLTSDTSSRGLYHRIIDIRTNNYQWIQLGIAVALPDGSDFNDVTEATSSWVLGSSYTYTNSPLESGVNGTLATVGSSYVTQIVYSSLGEIFIRRKSGNSWSAWQSVGNAVMIQLANGSDANDLKSGRTYLLPSSYSYDNMPESGTTAMLEVNLATTGYVMQRWYGTNGHVYIRSYTGSEWREWKEVSGDEITYNIDNISNTYNVTATPEITTDDLYILTEASDPTTDRTNDIATMLATNKVCRLGVGTFVVKNLSLLDDNSLIGCGNKTVLQLSSDNDAEYCLRVQGNRVSVSNMLINGNGSGRELTTPENKDGILLQGTYDPEQGTVSNPPQFANLHDLIIRNFTGSGIKHIYTGTQTQASVRGNNIYMYYCSVGLNINDRAEYNTYTNVVAIFNNKGLINNGGNNTFSNCDFSRNRTGVVMDGTSQDNYNNGHGALVNCKINHNGQNNDGDGLVMTNINNGFIIDGCQMFFGKINLTNCVGVNISNLNGNIPRIDITNGRLILLDKIVFANTPTISVSGNANVHVTNCYKQDGTQITN